MLIELLPLLIGAAVIAHCFFLVVALRMLSSKLSNKLLAATLFFLAIRIGGCIAGLIYDDFELTGLYIGALSFSVIGPLYYFYLRSLWSPSFRLTIKHYYHLSILILTLAALPFLTVELAFGLYLIALLAMITYTIAGLIHIRRSSAMYRKDDMRWKWTRYFNIGVGLLMVLFFSQSLFFDALIYQGIIIASAFILYGLTLYALKQVKLFMHEPKKGSNSQQIEVLGHRIANLLEKEETFTNPFMSVTLLAKQLNEPAYLVSLAVNAHFDKSFPELINALRIKRAEALLTDHSKSHFTIEAIAYESGFNALSAFYSAFRKAHRQTPKTFRNQRDRSKP
ncbi:hypothetical protein BFP97_04650 [Roseivirga sp. 4D4]|uniref:AraC family transcriptional regulator n=1 Tax=Roseivirga sp. 4D4 TaxID=1889784 RepID=UPI000853D556|nr:helix-turn-helix domain-containing protein [Roseivirga sp. 4D4]OEK00841.1 hypothetical protein BFP97_04650 [Roseivirga sp. 4D4]